MQVPAVPGARSAGPRLSRDRGLHDTFYTAAGGRSAQFTRYGTTAVLGSGVTTVRTTGSRAHYAEINLKAEIDKGSRNGSTHQHHGAIYHGRHG